MLPEYSKYWVDQDESIVAEIIKKDPTKVVAMEYLACLDTDSYVIFNNMADYESYKEQVFTSIYSGWITLDFGRDKLFGINN